MDRQLLIKKFLTRKEVKDYTYAILFFVISSFFTLFAIKPALSIAFSLRRQAFDLERINAIYEKNILKLVDIQFKIENIRDKTYLLEQTVPKKPETKTLVDNIKQVASAEGILINNLSLSSVDLKKEVEETKLRLLLINMETTAEFAAAHNFIEKITQQKRIKTIKNLKILKGENSSTDSAHLKIMMEIEGYYL